MLDPVAYRPYGDPDEFIREVTDRIWVDRDVAHIEENYEPDSVVHLGLGTVTSRAEVIEGSLMRLAQTATQPGARPAQAEDVVWEARGEDAFLSSHLILRAEQRLVNGAFRRLQVHSVANCLYRRGRMVEEWVVRDTLAQVLQSGLDPDAEARTRRFRGFRGSMTEPAPADVLAVGDSGARPDLFRTEVETVLELIEQVWNRHDYSRVKDLMVRDLFLYSVGEATYIRALDYQNETLRLRLGFPNARFEVRDVQTNVDPRYAGLRVAVLWTMGGRYDGQPIFGSITNQDVNLLGVSHFLVQDGRIVRERRIWDDVALRAQINAGRGDGPEPVNDNLYFA